MLDIAMLIYACLIVLAIWRYVCFYWCCGLWMSVLNYVALLYIIMAVASVYLTISFYRDAQQPLDVIHYPEAADLWSIAWLKPFTLAAPAAVVVTMALNWLQTESHVFEIHKRFAPIKHDRAVQIIALPTVFGVMALASMLPLYALLTGQINANSLKSPWHDFVNPLQLLSSAVLVNPVPGLMGNWTATASTAASAAANEIPAAWEEAKALALWRYETCFYVADLFEAWSLFQFGKLILEHVAETFTVKDVDEESHANKLQRDLMDSHSAVTSLTWVGTSMFVVLCIVQSAVSLWPYLGGSQDKQEMIMFNLNIAGFVVSCAAIYNLIVVEQAFHRRLSPISPVLKFLSVKLLVSLSFLQKSVIGLGTYGNELLPGQMRQVIKYVPILGDILSMSDIQMHLFYPALVIFECLFLALLHLCVWRSSEIWYREVGTENEPLVAKDVPASPFPGYGEAAS